MLSIDEKLMHIKFRNTEIGKPEMNDIYDLVTERLIQYLQYKGFKYNPSIDIANDIILPGMTLQHFIFLNVILTIYNLKKVKSTAILGYIFRNGLQYFILQQCEA